MLFYHASALLLILQLTFGFPRDKTTETPDIPPMNNPKLRRPTHISEFTDPDTGLNPFLDLEEGLTIGRNIMEDERRDDQPYFDGDLIEGDAPDRTWNLQEPKEHLGRMPARRPEFDYKDESDFQVLTTPRIHLPSPLTTVELFVSKDTEKLKMDYIDTEKEIQSEVEKEERETVTVSQNTVIYATVTISIMIIITVIVGACLWRKKLKSSRTSSATETVEVKS